MNIVKFCNSIGDWVMRFVLRLGEMCLFLLQALQGAIKSLPRPGLAIAQLYHIGVLTILIILVSGLFVGMVLGLQGYNQLVDFGAESSLGLMVSLLLVRELGPVLGALLFAGRAGSAIAAEVGLMKATDQLAAIEMMAVNPMMRIVGPRFIAGLIALPLLVAMFNVVGVFGGYLVGHGLFGLDGGQYWSSMQNGVDLVDDILNGIIKSIVFAFIVVWIALFEGYNATPTAEGVSRATTSTVVLSSLSILGGDYFLTALMFKG